MFIRSHRLMINKVVMIADAIAHTNVDIDMTTIAKVTILNV